MTSVAVPKALTPPALDALTTPALYALVPCAGIGARAGAGLPKQYALLAGRSVVARTIDALSGVSRLAAMLLVLAPDDTRFEPAVPGYGGQRQWLARCGGATRAQSVSNGLRELRARGAHDDDWVLVHDAARCLLQPQWVDALIDACLDDSVGGLLALPLADTLKHEVSSRIAATLDRSGKWAAQTPQMFRLGLLQSALDQALNPRAAEMPAAAGLGALSSKCGSATLLDPLGGRPASAGLGALVTDEASAVERLGLAPKLVHGDAANFKLTTPADFALAERLLASQGPLALRIGEGWDSHALVPGRPLILGGVTIPHSHGLLGHSDADALLHAITDALLGAAGLGDIGQHFPDTDAQFRGADSLLLLAEAAHRVRCAGWAIGNVDATIIAQAPRMAQHIPSMRERIATALALTLAAVNIKAKTAEGMGPVGEGRAIEARAVCLLRSRGA